MSNNTFFNGIGKLAVFGFVIVFGLALAAGCMVVGYQNQGVSLRNNFDAQHGKVELAYDTMWKKIAQQAQVTDAAKEGFKDVYHGLMEARYSGQNPAFLWLHEHNPDFDLSMFRQLMNTIDGERESLEREQTRLLDIRMQYDNLRERFPSSLVCGGMQNLPDVPLITSSRSQEVIRTGQDNDINVFGNGRAPTGTDTSGD